MPYLCFFLSCRILPNTSTFYNAVGGKRGFVFNFFFEVWNTLFLPERVFLFWFVFFPSLIVKTMSMMSAGQEEDVPLRVWLITGYMLKSTCM